MEVHIREEQEEDFEQITYTIQEAFKGVPHSDQTEHQLVARLRQSSAYLPSLALVATWEKQIVGHILLTRIHVQGKEHTFSGLALAPVSVLPIFQNKGIGSSLIQRAHQKARNLHEKFIVLIGHEHYYPRFGYQEAKPLGIYFPFEVPSPNAMVYFLDLKMTHTIQGSVQYPPAFFEETSSESR